MDRLSELPDSLIHHIFSFLPMEYVVRTTFLSKRWKDLWTTVPCISFISESENFYKFSHIVIKTLVLWKGTKIQRLNMFMDLLLGSYEDVDMHMWVEFALRHKIEELGLFNFCNEGNGYWFPECLYSASSLRKLRLYGCYVHFFGEICWNQLKSLYIHSMNMEQETIDSLLLGSPQLEVFELSCGRNLNVCSTSLKKLFLHFDAEDHYTTVEELESMMHINTPNLEVLRISGSVCLCLLMLVPSLIEATLDCYELTYNFEEILSDCELRWDALWIIFRCINHVEKLEVGDWCIKVLTAVKKTAMPLPLLNLKCLIVDTSVEDECLAGVVNLLEISPNVIMLSIKNSYIGYSDEEDDDEEELDYDEDGDSESDDVGDSDDDDDAEEAEDEWERLKESLLAGVELGDSLIPEVELSDSLIPEVELTDSLIPEVELSDSFLMNLRILEIELSMWDSLVFSLAKFVLKRASALEKMVITVIITKPYDQDVLLRETQELLRITRSSPNAKVDLRRRTPRRVYSGFDYSFACL